MRDVHRCVTVDYQQIGNGNKANQIHGFPIDYGKFILICCRCSKMFCYNSTSEVLQEYFYCSQCGAKLDIVVPSFRLPLSSENLTEKEAVATLTVDNFSYVCYSLFS